MPTFADRKHQESGTLEPRAQICGLDSHKLLIEGYLADLAFSDDPRLAGLVRAMRRALLSKGERLPFEDLIQEGNASGGGPPTGRSPSASGGDLSRSGLC